MVVFLPIMCPPAATVIRACRVSPTSHSRTLDRSGFPSVDKCASRWEMSPFPSGRNASHTLQPLLCAEAGPPITCQAGMSVNGSQISSG